MESEFTWSGKVSRDYTIIIRLPSWVIEKLDLRPGDKIIMKVIVKKIER